MKKDQRHVKLNRNLKFLVTEILMNKTIIKIETRIECSFMFLNVNYPDTIYP